MKKLISGLVVIIVLFAISGCAKKPVTEKPIEEVTITEETIEETTEEVTTTEEEIEVTEETTEVTEEETTEEATEEVTEETPEESVVLAESQIPDVSFEIKDKEELEKVLLEFGFWEKVGLLRETYFVKPKKLTIYLTEKEQLLLPKISEGEVLYSAGTSFDGENYNLFLHVEPSIMKELEENILSKEVDWLFFKSLYLLTHWEEEWQDEEVLKLKMQECDKLFTEYQEKEESTFFEIKKH